MKKFLAAMKISLRGRFDIVLHDIRDEKQRRTMVEAIGDMESGRSSDQVPHKLSLRTLRGIDVNRRR